MSLSAGPPSPDWTPIVAQLIDRKRRLALAVADRWPSSPAFEIAQAVDRERGRLGRELHTGAGQALAGIRIHLGILSRQQEGLNPVAADALNRLDALVDQASLQIRAISHKMAAPACPDSDLVSAIRSLMASSGLQQSMLVRLNLAPLPFEPGEEVRTALYRCTQECVANIANHSGATQVEVTLSTDERTVSVSISDNGPGFDPGASHGGLGLRAIREYAESVSGSVTIASDSSGTRVAVSVPLHSRN